MDTDGKHSSLLTIYTFSLIKTVICPRRQWDAFVTTIPQNCQYFCISITLLIKNKRMCLYSPFSLSVFFFITFLCFYYISILSIKVTGFTLRPQASTSPVDHRFPVMKRSYLQTTYMPLPLLLHVSVTLPIALSKQPGMDLKVKRNADFADHFTTHCRVIDSPVHRL